MKKLIALFLAATIWSCSNEEQINTDAAATAVTSESVLEGKILSFKNEESFVKEYSSLAALHSEELKNWVSSKGLVSLLNVPTESVEIEEDVIPKSKIIYSDALKSILNSDSKVKIAGKVLWLNERNFYLLSENEINKTSEDLLNEKDKLQIYGQLLSISKSNKNITSRYVLPNENRIITFSSEEMNVSGSRLRHVVDLYNETIVLNDAIQTSKMFVRSILQYRSCSTFRCTWKEAFNLRNVISNFSESVPAAWWPLSNVSTINGVTGTQTYLIANWRVLPSPANPESWYPNFVISGPITCSIVGASVPGVSINLSWY